MGCASRYFVLRYRMQKEVSHRDDLSRVKTFFMFANCANLCKLLQQLDSCTAKSLLELLIAEPPGLDYFLAESILVEEVCDKSV